MIRIPDAREMGYLRYPRKQTSVSCAADCGAIVCYGWAKPTDLHLLSVDEETISWLEKREAERRRDKCNQTRRGSINVTLPS
jgi:hypothetical protein